MTEWIIAVILICITLLSFAAWCTHIMSCFILGTWGFLVAGALFFPIGIIHGFGLWLGIW